MILVLGLVVALIGAWLAGTQLVPNYVPVGEPQDITTAGPFFYGSAGYLIRIGREYMIVTEVLDHTHAKVDRFARVGWTVKPRRLP